MSKFNDGTPILNITNDQGWVNATAPAWCYYNNDSQNNNVYGKLYNFYAVSDNSKNVCPVGWHVPSAIDVMSLKNNIGGLSGGGHLKEAGLAHWASPNFGATNSTGFTALPGGWRNINDGTFSQMGTHAYFFTGINFIYLTSDTSVMVENSFLLGNQGYSIRCVKD